jgi:deoxyribonuclease I
MKMAVILTVCLALVTISGAAEAANCKKGIPCGNSCISASKVCHIPPAGSGTAAAPKSGSAPASGDVPATVTCPPGRTLVPGSNPPRCR